jgi:hypothetical protein
MMEAVHISYKPVYFNGITRHYIRETERRGRLVRIREIPDSNLGPETLYPYDGVS